MAGYQRCMSEASLREGQRHVRGVAWRRHVRGVACRGMAEASLAEACQRLRLTRPRAPPGYECGMSFAQKIRALTSDYYLCPHTTKCASAYYYMCVLCVCPHSTTTICVSYMCLRRHGCSVFVLCTDKVLLLYVCPHTTTCDALRTQEEEIVVRFARTPPAKTPDPSASFRY